MGFDSFGGRCDRRRPAPTSSACQVLGCQGKVQTRSYGSRHHVCALHLKALAVQLRDPPPIAGSSARSIWYRWCQQCSRMEPLSCFDGTKRSCANSLEQRRCRRSGQSQQQQQQQQQPSPGRRSIQAQSDDTHPTSSASFTSFAQPVLMAAAGQAATSQQLLPAPGNDAADSWDACWTETDPDAGGLALLLHEGDDLLDLSAAEECWPSGLDSPGNSELYVAGNLPAYPQQHLLPSTVDGSNNLASSSSADTQAGPSGSVQGDLLLPPAAAAPWPGSQACNGAPPSLLQHCELLQKGCAAPPPAQPPNSQAAGGPATRAVNTTWQMQQQQQQEQQELEYLLEAAALEAWLEQELRAAAMVVSAEATSKQPQPQPALLQHGQHHAKHVALHCLF